jgi:uncharacterized membrane protein YdbT with pleckstrin-like domain
MQAAGTHGSPRDTPEEELWEGAYSPQAMIGPSIGAGLLIIAGAIAASVIGPYALIATAVGVCLLIYCGFLLLYRRMTVKYRLTTHRLVLQKGILSRTDDRIMLVDIDDITVRQGLVERMFNVGTIVLNTNDKTAPVLTMLGIENPRQVGDVIDEARRTERSRRGLYMMNA